MWMKLHWPWVVGFLGGVGSSMWDSLYSLLFFFFKKIQSRVFYDKKLSPY